MYNWTGSIFLNDRFRCLSINYIANIYIYIYIYIYVYSTYSSCEYFEKKNIYIYNI